MSAQIFGIRQEREDGLKPAPPIPPLQVRAALFALRFYKAYLSILFAGSCRFEPTCSQYAYQAIERFGLVRGVWLGTKRLLRCHPFSRRFGFDPIPEYLAAHTGSNVVAGLQTHAFSSANLDTSGKNRGYDLCEPFRDNSHEVPS